MKSYYTADEPHEDTDQCNGCTEVYLAAEADAHIAELEDLLRCWLANHAGALAPSELYQVAKRTSEIVGGVSADKG